MTALLLALLLVAPIQPVGFAWEIAPEPPPPAVAPPNWVPFRLDELRVSLRSPESATVEVGVYYRIAGQPALGWVSWRVPIFASFSAGQTRTLAFEVPWSGYAPGPALLAVWSDCGDGRVHHQGAAIPRPGEALPPELAGMPFAALASGAFCPELPPLIFADGFESGGLRRWSGSW